MVTLSHEQIINKDALVLIHERNQFYQKKYRIFLGFFCLSLLLIGILSGFIIYLVKEPAHPYYFATDAIGRLIIEPPLTEPNFSLAEISLWATKAVERAYSYDYINYRAQLQKAQNYFTDYGWQNFMKALQLSNNLLAVINRKQVVIAKVIEPPVLLHEGVLGGSYAWKLQLRLLITYLYPPYDNKPENTVRNALNVIVIITRQNILTSADGLGIMQLISNSA